MLRTTFFLLVSLLLSQTGWCFDVVSKDETALAPYNECIDLGAASGAEAFGFVDLSDLSDLISIPIFLNELLQADLKFLTEFLDKENRVAEPDYVDQALAIINSHQPPEAINCFIESFNEGDEVFRFHQQITYGQAWGAAIVNDRKIKAIIYNGMILD